MLFDGRGYFTRDVIDSVIRIVHDSDTDRQTDITATSIEPISNKSFLNIVTHFLSDFIVVVGP